MVRFRVRLQRVIEVETGREHARVLAGALALELRLRFQSKRDASCLLWVGWWRHTAAQSVLVEIDLSQHARHTPLMSRCRVVRGTGQCQVLRLKVKGIGGATFDERDGLERFRRGSEVGNVVGITVGSD